MTASVRRAARRVTAPGTPATVGFVGPLGTDEGVVARPMLAAVHRGVAHAGAGLDLDVRVRAVDDRRDAGEAARVVAELAADPSVIGVVGPKNSGTARAAVPVARSAGLPLVLPAATGDDLCVAGAGTVFRMCATDTQTAQAAAAVCRREAVARLAVVPDETPYGRSLSRAVIAAAHAARITVVSDSAEADAVFLAMGEVEQATALRGLRSAGNTALVVGAEGGPGAPLAALAGTAAEGSLQLYAGAAVEGAQSVYEAESHDAALALIAAFAAAGSRSAMCDELHRTQVPGDLGTLRFSPRGERVGTAVTLWHVRDGRCVPARDLPM